MESKAASGPLDEVARSGVTEPGSMSGPGGTVVVASGAGAAGAVRGPAETVAVEAEVARRCGSPAPDAGDQPRSDGSGRDGGREDSTVTREEAGRYAWVEELGAGGIGRVCVVFDRHLERQVALKELHVGLSGLGSGRGVRASWSPRESRFVNEARVTGQLEHPGIVPVYELGRRADGTLYYTMRRVRGRTLGAVLTGRDLAGRLDLLPHLVAVCNAVAFAHARGVVHRDLKPENVMIGAFGETVVVDWGLAKRREGEDVQGAVLAAELALLRGTSGHQTVAGMPIGTPAYMSPEQARGELASIDERSDVYSLGAILYELIVGEPPFTGTDALQIVRKVYTEPAPNVRAREPRCPLELAAIATRALAKAKEERYPDAQALAADLAAFLTGGLVAAHRYGWGALARRWLRRHAVAIGVAAGLLLVGVGAWSYRGLTQERAEAAAAAAHTTALLGEVDALLDEVARGPTSKNWLDVYAFKLVVLREPAVEARLQGALAHPNDDVRRLVARALGGMKSSASVEVLAARLGEGGEPSSEVLVEIINALGVIGDPRAEGPVARARFAAGQGSALWRRTELAYRMIPLPLLVADGRELGFDALVERGKALDNKGDHAAAEAAYTRALELRPRSAKVLNNRALARRARHDLEGALADFDRALAIEPGVVATLNNRALVRKDLGDYPGAVADHDRVVAAGSVGAVALRNRARARVYVGDYAGALADVEVALRVDPKSAANFGTLATVAAARNDWQAALGALDRAIALDPGYVFALTLRATVHSARGDLAAAVSDLERALAADPEEPRAAIHRALIAQAAGDGATAQRVFDRAVAGHPEYAALRAYRAALLGSPRRDVTPALGELTAAIGREGAPVARAELLILRAALELESGRLVAARATLDGLPGGDATRFHVTLRRLARGETPLRTALELARVPEQACVAVLAAGLRAELASDRTGARDAYDRVPEIARPADPSCAVALRRAAAVSP